MALNAHNPADVLRLRISQVGKDFKLSRSFTLGELASKDGADIVIVHPALLLGLQALRDIIGKAVKVNSGYRSVEHNKTIGGATNSLHTLGMAADVVVDNVSPLHIASIARDLGFGGVKAYPTFTHIDVGRIRTW
jgi:zinc D-Ala-D-Ala carboxypeptidase